LFDNVEKPLEVWSQHQETGNISNLFGGKTLQIISCRTCGNISKSKEIFWDLDLYFSGEENQIDLETMITKRNSVELLMGDNQYFCTKCQKNQDAEKSTTLIEPPKFLIISLNRFQYDRTLKKKAKIMKWVDFSPTFRLKRVMMVKKLNISMEIDEKLPISENMDVETSESHSKEKAKEQEQQQEEKEEEGVIIEVPYELYSIVVHSGVTPDSGHYFTYAKDFDSGEEANLDNSWFLFNDGSVAETTLTKIYENLKAFPSDTPYMLLYRQLQSEIHDPLNNQNDPQLESLNHHDIFNQTAIPKTLLVNEDLRSLISKDNLKYLQELSTEGSSGKPSLAGLNTFKSGKRPPKRDDDDHPRGPPFGFGGPSRFIY